MKKVFLLPMIGISLVYLTGCAENKTRVGEGSIIGGIVGATAGGIIGHQSGHGGEGAAIGAAAGVLTGAVAGSQIEKPQAAAAPQATGQPAAIALSVHDVAALTKQGVSESYIIDKIHVTNSKFNLTSDDIAYLKQQGVSQNVISAMQGA